MPHCCVRTPKAEYAPCRLIAIGHACFQHPCFPAQLTQVNLLLEGTSWHNRLTGTPDARGDAWIVLSHVPTARDIHNK